MAADLWLYNILRQNRMVVIIMVTSFQREFNYKPTEDAGANVKRS